MSSILTATADDLPDRITVAALNHNVKLNKGRSTIPHDRPIACPQPSASSTARGPESQCRGKQASKQANNGEKSLNMAAIVLLSSVGSGGDHLFSLK